MSQSSDSQYPPPAPKHSGVGIASLMLGVISVLGLIGTMVVAVIVAANDPTVFQNDSTSVTIALQVCALLCMLLSLVGVALGVGGLAQRERRRLFPVIGLSVNAGIVLLVLGLVVLESVGG